MLCTHTTVLHPPGQNTYTYPSCIFCTIEFKSNWIVHCTIHATNPLQKFVCIKLLVIWPLFINRLFFALNTVRNYKVLVICYMRANSIPFFKSPISDDWLFQGKIDAVNSFAQFWPQTDVRQECAKNLDAFYGKISETDDWHPVRQKLWVDSRLGWQQWKSSGSAEHQIKLLFTVHSCLLSIFQINIMGQL